MAVENIDGSVESQSTCDGYINRSRTVEANVNVVTEVRGSLTLG
jgi:hypothetical protein